jgi:peptide/nickel transport system substrate-binding protein
VVFAWHTQVDETVAWPGVFDKEAIAAVEAQGDHTVAFRFTRSYPYQLQDANEGLIIPSHAWSSIPYEQWEDTDWSRVALAAGPFRVARHEPRQEIVLEANPSFWDPTRPLLERVVFRVVPDPIALHSQFKSGALDFVENVPAADAERLRDDPRVTVVVYPDRSYAFVAWNNDHPVLGNVAVRRALTLAVDRRTILDSVRRGYGRLATGPVLSGMWAFNHDLTPLPFDPGRARELLAEAGFADHDGDGWLDRGGTALELELLPNSESQDRRDVALLVQRDLERVGVRARTRFLEHGAVLDRRNRGDFDAVISSWLEPTQVDLHDIWHSAPPGEETNNFVRYANPEVDALVEKAAGLSDFAAQKPVFDRIQELIVADQPYTFLYERDAVAGLSRRIGGAVVNDATPFFNLDRWYLKPGSR